MGQVLRGRRFRDPVHGDIRLGPIQAAIVDTPVFQRLRYIKQNGLLHFVFPGAVHTRFAHSIGTCHVARLVFDNIAEDFRATNHKIGASDFRYIEQVFLTAALLHDCGHLAFSHSIEGLKLKGGEHFLKSLNEIAREWSIDSAGEIDLEAWLSEIMESGVWSDSSVESRVTHEMLSILFIQYLNNYTDLTNLVSEHLDVDASHFFGDVQSLIDERFAFSNNFEGSAKRISQGVKNIESVSEDDRADHLHKALSSLISGTLDVDRMDYLLRDSLFTGTSYGKYDFHTIVNSCRIGVFEPLGQLMVCIEARAVCALEDFLWGRYQLFNQVLNHKANVILNGVLAIAISELVDSSARLARPSTFEEFLVLTDESVMSVMREESTSLSKKRVKVFKKVFVDRKLPTYFGKVDLTNLPDEFSDQDLKQEEERLIAKEKKRISRDQSVSEDDIRTQRTESTLLRKVTAPYIIRYDKNANEEVIESFVNSQHSGLMSWGGVAEDQSDDEADSLRVSIPASVKHVHFFFLKENA